ncbi:hypothetical protein DAEQUDRAFT_597293 [Daedalea quercina L-15889]|uniref:Uncharacterized protein n=1 Tax=Daedalea quercina L-15889 TaxID=1314783 RepID=A0A165SZR4_9APHY|nr:hypothetical protein DAEQUDRAFT_597293 [Daedalea quercina L-15889]
MEMYQTGYPVLPTFVPTAGPAPPPKVATTSTTNQIAFPSQAYANPAVNYNDYGPYPSYANGYQPAASTLPPGSGPAYNTAYGAAPAPAPANAPVRKASQRKQVPPLNLSAARANPPAYQATQTTDNAATPTLANPYGTTPNLTPDPPLSAVSPRAKRGSASLLNTPVHLAYSDEGSEGEGKTRNRTSSHSRTLDPNLPQLPRAGPLPDQFGAQSDVAVRDEKAAIRQLTVSGSPLSMLTVVPNPGCAGPERVTVERGPLAVAPSIPHP